MDLNILKYQAFIKTVEYGSFTKASEILNYSQSGISRMINDLENEWSLTLLERNKKGVKLTSDGTKILPFAKTLCADFERLQREIHDIHGLRSGMIRIGTFSSVATYWLPEIISAFKKDFPEIEYELLLGDYTEIQTWISEGRVDCGFLKLPTNPAFETTLLEKDDLVAVLPKDHPLTKSKKVSLSSLTEYPFLLLEKGEKAEVSELFQKYKLTPNTQFTTWDDYSIMSMVEKNLGVSILPRLILKRTAFDFDIRELDVPAYREIVFALRDKKTASIAVKKFMEYLVYRDAK